MAEMLGLREMEFDDTRSFVLEKIQELLHTFGGGYVKKLKQVKIMNFAVEKTS